MTVRAQTEPELEPSLLRPPALGVRALQVVYAPGALFDRLRDRPLWGAALLLGAAAVVLSFLLVPAEVWEASFREQVLSSGRDLPEGFSFSGLARVFGTVAAGVFWFVWAFLLAGVLAFVFAFVLGDEARYAQYLSVVSHALLIAAAGALLTVPLKVAQGDPQLTLNLGAFAVGLDEGSYAARVLRLLDLFMLWSYAVMAVGISRLEPRRSWQSAAAFLLVVAVGLALAFALFTPA